MLFRARCADREEHVRLNLLGTHGEPDRDKAVEKMGHLAPLIAEIQVLCTMGDRTHEELSRLTIEGQAFTDALATQVRKINSALDALGGTDVSLLINDNQIDDEMLEFPQQFVTKSWRCVISKG